jgi:hypothetical protein
MAYKAWIMNRHGVYVSALYSDSQPTPGTGEVFLCPPSTGIKIAKVITMIETATQFRDGTSLDLIIGLEIQ